MDLQDKLHHGLGKQRTIVSIGTHDLDKIQGPFEYTAEKLSDIKFVALNMEKEMTGQEIVDHFKKDKNMKAYTEIVDPESGMIPLIKDANGNILSMPPLINSEFSKIETSTKNVFIDITATDETKAIMALNVVVTLFSFYSEKPFSFQQIDIEYESNKSLNKSLPNFDLERDIVITKEYIERLLGETGISDQQVLDNLLKMGLPTKVLIPSSKAKNDIGEFSVHVPLHRTDVLHQCDVAEDFAIGYGYNNISVQAPLVVSVGQEFRLNKLTEQMRVEMAACGYAECMTFALCSVEDMTTNILKEEDPRIVNIANPKASDFEAGRTTLLPGLLKCINSNKNNKLPLKLFEIADVMLKVGSEGDDMNGMWNHQNVLDRHIGAVNQRRLSVVLSNVNSSELDFIHGTLDYIFKKLYLEKKYSYKLKKCENEFLFEGLQANIFLVNEETGKEMFESERIGYLGVVHPEILKRMGWVLSLIHI